MEQIDAFLTETITFGQLLVFGVAYAILNGIYQGVEHYIKERREAKRRLIAHASARGVRIK